jgi:hypothetical protein
MSQKNKTSRLHDCVVAPAITIADSGNLDVLLQKRKEQAKQTLYLNRV